MPNPSICSRAAVLDSQEILTIPLFSDNSTPCGLGRSSTHGQMSSARAFGKSVDWLLTGEEKK